MQFQVPQNIAMEDRIMGPLTAIQFGIVILGGGITFIIYTSTTIPAPLNLFGALFMGMLTVVLALGKYNDQPMYRFIRFILAFIASPKVRIWRKLGVEGNLVKEAPAVEKKQHSASKRITRQDIANLSSIIDSRGQIGTLPRVPAQQKPK